MSRRRNYTNGDNLFGDLAGSLVGLFMFGLLFLGATYYVNKSMFWSVMNHYVFPALGILALVIGAYILFLFQKKRQREHHLGTVLQQIADVGFEGSMKSFIERFGKEKTENFWEYRGHIFDSKRLEDFRESLIQAKVAISTKPTEDYDELFEVLRYFINKQEKDFLTTRIQAKVAHDLSELGKRGDDFELLVVRLYDAMGYASKRIGGHGDQGGDVLASKEGEIILIQAKCYQGTVGNAAVQEATAARAYYGCTQSAVITTSSFTNEAVALAKSNSVELIDGKLLKQRLLQYLGEIWQ